MNGADAAWRVKHRAVTGSTNKDALGGKPGDVFTADYQTAGRGRLDHQWLSPSGENLMMSAVIGVANVPPEEGATLPLVVGLAVAKTIEAILFHERNKGLSLSPEGRGFCEVRLKWPNDVLIDGRKVSGILCERKDDRVIAGLGINVNQRVFDPAIAARATSMRLVLEGKTCTGQPFPDDLRSTDGAPQAIVLSVSSVRDAVLEHLAAALMQWRSGGFRSIWPEIAARDFLKGQTVTVRRTDGDVTPATGLCGGIRADGALDVEGEAIFAGEACICRVMGS